MNTGPGVKFYQCLADICVALSAPPVTGFALKFDLVAVPPPAGPAPAQNSVTLASYPGYTEAVPAMVGSGEDGLQNVFTRTFIQCADITFTGPTSGPAVLVYGYACKYTIDGALNQLAHYVAFPVPLLLTNASSTIVVSAPFFTLVGAPFDRGVTYTP
jgi:hypothetical protein